MNLVNRIIAALDEAGIAPDEAGLERALRALANTINEHVDDDEWIIDEDES